MFAVLNGSLLTLDFFSGCWLRCSRSCRLGFGGLRPLYSLACEGSRSSPSHSTLARDRVPGLQPTRRRGACRCGRWQMQWGSSRLSIGQRCDRGLQHRCVDRTGVRIRAPAANSISIAPRLAGQTGPGAASESETIPFVARWLPSRVETLESPARGKASAAQIRLKRLQHRLGDG